MVDDRYGLGALGPRILLHTDEVSRIAPERLELYRIEPPQELLKNVSAQLQHASSLLSPSKDAKKPLFKFSDSVVAYLLGKPPKLREGRVVRIWEVRSPHSPLPSPIHAAQYDALAYLQILGVKSIYDLSPLARKLYVPQRPKTALAIPRIPQRPIDSTAPTAREWQQIIDEAARLFGLDSTFVAAMIQVESNFDHRAISTAGAQGAMQIMPKTQELLGLKDPFDARANIYAGCAYIRALLNKYQKPDLALAAYNAGPGAVDRFCGIPPYRETQNYVRKVMELWQPTSFAMQLPTPKDKARAHSRKKKRKKR